MPNPLGERVRRLRQARSLTQEELAQAAGGLDQTVISRIETREGHEPGVFLLYKIARVLNTDLNSLLEGVVDFTPLPIEKSESVSRLQEDVGRLASQQATLTEILDTVRSELRAIRNSVEAEKPRKTGQSRRRSA